MDTTNLSSVLQDLKGSPWTTAAFRTISVEGFPLLPPSATLHRSEIALALNMLLFVDLVDRVPAARTYVDEVIAAGGAVTFDHGALRTVQWASGELPPGEASITRVLRPLGYFLNETYPLEQLKMTGRSWAHADHPEHIAQFFVSELHPERFSQRFQLAVSRVIGNSRDPLTAADTAVLEQLARDKALPRSTALALLPRLMACFSRHHAACHLEDYEVLLNESSEMAWIATEGQVFNHATDRVPDVDAVAARQRELGRPIKDVVERSATGRVRQTAFKAADVPRSFRGTDGKLFTRSVPGSFYEFISRDRVGSAPGSDRLDLAFDAGNATAIFGMTRATTLPT